MAEGEGVSEGRSLPNAIAGFREYERIGRITGAIMVSTGWSYRHRP